MNRIKISENFFLDEFVPKELHDKIIADVKDDNYIKELAIYQDERIPPLVQWIRTETGISVNGNNWVSGGDFDERGVRMPNATTGAKYSQHKMRVDAKNVVTKRSCAQDIQIGTMSGKLMYDWAYEHRAKLYELGVRCIEHHSLTPWWLHMDMRKVLDADTILIVDKTDIVAKWQIK